MCRRWRRLSQAPQLLRQLWMELDFHGDSQARLLPCLRSVGTWMARAATHVRSLSLELNIGGPLSAAERAEVEALLASTVAACGVGGLQRLQLATISALRFSSWLGMAPSLRWLKLLAITVDDGDVSSDLTVPLTSLTCLGHLAMHDLLFSGAEQGVQALPASLTSLDLTQMGYYLPSQVCTCRCID